MDVFKIGRSTKRFIFFEFIYFVLAYVLYICMFPACCFRQRTCEVQGLLNGVLYENWTHSCFQYKWFLSGQICFYEGFCSSFLENVYIGLLYLFVVASHQTQLDSWSKARRPIKVRIKGRGNSGTSWDSNPAAQCCSSSLLVQCEPDEASSFTNPNVGPGTYAGLWLELDSKV